MNLNEHRLLMTLAAAAASANGDDQRNDNCRGITVIVDLTAVSGTSPTCVVTIEGLDPQSGKYFTLLASASLTGVGTTILKVFPGATASANAVANDQLPKFWRVKTTIGGTTPSFTGKIAASLVA